MTFDKLADRCLLFVDDDKALLIELIKEAERELTRHCNILEAETSYEVTGLESGRFTLNSTFKQVILATFDGDKISLITEDEVSLEDDNTIRSGTPTAYYIRNNYLFTNYAPTTGDLKVAFDGALSVNGGDSPSQGTTNITIPEMFGNDLCNYAVAVSSAKLNPGMHDKHWMLWNQSIETITNQDADRELIHTIKREV